MRILHTSDWHLGRTFHGLTLHAEHAAFIDHIEQIVRDEMIDAVLLSGDVYDRSLPPVESVELLNDAMERLSALTHVVLTPGNHDSATRLGFGHRLFTDRVHVQPSITDVAQAIELPDRDGNIGAVVYALPYLDPDVARAPLASVLFERQMESSQEPLPRSHQAVMGGALRLVGTDLSTRSQSWSRRIPVIAMAHAFVTGGEVTDSERDIRVGGVDSVSSSLFTTLGYSERPDRCPGLDYVALGHLHRPQILDEGAFAFSSSSERDEERRPALVYSGSALPFSFSEAAHQKSNVVIDTESGTWETITTPFDHRIERVSMSMDECESGAFDYLKDAWLDVTLTGERVPGAVSRLKHRFPHMLSFSYAQAAEPQRQSIAITRASDPLEVSGDFLSTMTGTTPTDNHLTILRQAYEASLSAGRSN
ncbi:metallophosphoesterase family protein [Actinomyces vulturis]|uniref:metallophosphoesterase family protein n=1 Tax=Actinomyces vulturis TaxID=1857645 RepID=UPI0008307A25|nr:exonuclease subunit SbcD [Actinomyces vulturis]